jgi:hypothetical protein
MDFVVGIARRFPILILIAVIGVGGVIFREHLTGAAADLRVGDCFTEPAELVDIKDVQHRPCSEPHDAEVFALFKHSAAANSPYPSDESFVEYLIDKCVPEFNSYTGRDLRNENDLDFSAFYPTQAGWQDGDRELTCYLIGLNGPLTSSQRAQAQAN